MRAGADADHGDKDIQAHRLHEPNGGAGNATQSGVKRVQPTEYEPGHEDTATSAESNRNIPEANGQHPDQRAKNNGNADENDIGLFGGTVCKTDVLCHAIDVFAAASQFKDVPTFQASAGQAG